MTHTFENTKSDRNSCVTNERDSAYSLTSAHLANQCTKRVNVVLSASERLILIQTSVGRFTEMLLGST